MKKRKKSNPVAKALMKMYRMHVVKAKKGKGSFKRKKKCLNHSVLDSE